MILWYSGCGNSQFVAQTIHSGIGSEELLFIPHVARNGKAFEFKSTDILGIVFPVYAWSVPKIVEEFIRNMHFKGKPGYIFVACTCGDETGYTARHIEDYLALRGLKMDAFFSFQMPETYINLPGFKLDTAQNADSKIERTRKGIEEAIEVIKARDKGVYDTLMGKHPFIKSHILKPLFYKLLITDCKFRSSSECIGCGICAKNCPLQNITIEDGKPKWHGNCTNCMSCYHRCPQNAIQFGRATRGKGQYYFGKRH